MRSAPRTTASSIATQPSPALPADRSGLTLLGAGHLVVDMASGAVPAFIPLFTAAPALSGLAVLGVVADAVSRDAALGLCAAFPVLAAVLAVPLPRPRRA